MIVKIICKNLGWIKRSYLSFTPLHGDHQTVSAYKLRWLKVGGIEFVFMPAFC